ncbi:MAG: radical SAM protein [Ignavibacteriae bacterium HGW-Ignavibacteriae-2]|nr:MAG: radical SAM protein [Ignavibacteriae bacterium HGW-Ignavibacteriae-2]
MNNSIVNHSELYRMPWTLPDNAISWLEPTSLCNLACDGCYRKNEKNSHKSLEEVKHELDIFQQFRKTDCISIAGGDPLLYPEIINLVAEIKSRGLKPIINTNGFALTKELLLELKMAGVFGFTFHVDSKQGRAGEWKNKNEIELNDLRYEYARLLADVGNISCSFNSTVYEDTLDYVPELINWAHKNIDIVQTMVFIAFRHIVPQMPFNWYAYDKQVDWQNVMYHSNDERNVDIKSTDILKKVKDKFPEFTPSAYLNGTDKSDSYKWMFTERVGNKEKIFGYVGSKFMELIMSSYHLFNDSYLSYASPKTTRMGRSSMLLLWPFDKKLKTATGKYIKYFAGNPIRIFKKAHLQTILFIQPVDFMEDGSQVMCDGCPDITVHNDKLVWSCRLEEPKQFGTFLRSVPKN